MKRFYKDVRVVLADPEFAVELDGRPVRTPKKAPLTLPTRALAEAVAAEWEAQGERIHPAEMPQTRLATTAIDRVRRERPHVVATVAGYGASDLVCYHVEGNAALLERQLGHWQPLRDWLEARYGVRLASGSGVVPIAQRPEPLARLHRLVDAYDDLRLTALHDFTTISGSLVIALALAEAEIDVEAAWQAGFVDELYQAELWGEDAEAADRRARLKAELAEARRFLDLLGAKTPSTP